MIELTSADNYKSIPPIAKLILPDFTVLTGINGAGKSQLLSAIREGAIQAAGVPTQKVNYVKSVDFIVSDASEQTTTTLASLREQFWNHYAQNIQGRYDPARGGTIPFSEEYSSQLLNKARALNKPVHQLDHDDLADNPDLLSTYLAYRQVLENTLYNGQFSPQHRFFQTLFEDEQVLFHKITRSILATYLQKDYQVGGVLPAQISATIFNYILLYRDNQFAGYLNQTEGQRNTVLTEADFTKTYGPKPWELIDDTFRDLNAASLSLDFDFHKFNPSRDGFRLEFIKKEGAKVIARSIPVQELSSGEKTLLALICSLYNSQISKDFPEVLLLDEVDASLHPSMVSSFLRLIQNELVNKRGTKVILVTHSPTTVALAPEPSLYVMSSSRRGNFINKQTKADALNLLTDGFVGITDETARTELKFKISGSPTDLIYVEGITDQAYLLEAAKRLGSDVFEDYNLLYAQGAGGLDNIWKVLKHLPQGNGLTHGKKVILLYDGDQRRQQSQYDGNRVFCMEFIGTNPIKTGIENLFTEDLANRVRQAVTGSIYDTPEGSLAIDEARKSEVANWVIANATDDEFKYLLAVVKELAANLQK